jgi:hypothetical protein
MTVGAPPLALVGPLLEREDTMEDTRRLVADETEPEAPAAAAVQEEAASPRLPASGGSDVPEWAIVPKDLRPPKGRQVIFLRIPAKLTDTPLKGERQCIVWTLSDGDEKLAAERCGFDRLGRGHGARSAA